MPAPKGNRNALKHGLYARHFPGDITKNLLRWEVDDFAAEIQLLRVALDKLIATLLAPASPQEGAPVIDNQQVVSLCNAISRSVTSLVGASRQHVLLSSRESPVLLAWFDTLASHEFFKDGEPPL